MKISRITEKEFNEAIGRLKAHGRTYNAARGVLVKGLSVQDACRPWRVSVQGVYKAMRRIIKATDPGKHCPNCHECVAFP